MTVHKTILGVALTATRHARLLTATILAISIGLSACSLSADQSKASSSEQTGTIMVIGASGRAGRPIIKRLKEQGYTLRAMTRNRERAISRVGDEYDWVEADVKDLESLKVALSGVDKIISTVGATPGRTPRPDDPDRPETVDFEGVRNLVDVAKENGVNRIVLMSAIGAGDATNPMNKFFSDVLMWKYKGESHLRNSGIDYTIIRPGDLQGELPGGKTGLRIEPGGTLGYKAGFTALDDLAELCIAALFDPNAINKTIDVINDDSLPPNRWHDAFKNIEVD
jgi:uncharacterized protein YbjT (DUF2867 family)